MAKPMIYLYTRYSTIEQATGDSKRRQSAMLWKKAEEISKRENIKVNMDMIMHDHGKSAFHQKNLSHGELGAFLRLIKSGSIPEGSFLIVEAIDRLTRAKHTDAKKLCDALTSAGIIIVTANDGEEYSEDGYNSDAGIKSSIILILNLDKANRESKHKKERVEASLIEDCERWVDGTNRSKPINGSRGVAWYDWDIKKEVWVENAKTDGLRMAIDLFKQGYGGTKVLKAVHKAYPDAKFPETIQWFHKTVKSRALLGERTFKVGGTSYVLEGYYPALMSEADFLDLQADLQARGRSISEQKVITVLSKATGCYCGYCSSSMRAQNLIKKLENNDLSNAYFRTTCISKTRGINNCNESRPVATRHIEQAIVTFCRKDLKMADYSSNKEAKRLEGLIKKADKKIAIKKKEQIAYTKNFMLLDVVTSDMKDILNETVRDQERAEEDKANLMQEAAKLVSIDDKGIAKAWKKIEGFEVATNTEARLALRELFISTFKKVVIYSKGETGDNNKEVLIAMQFRTGMYHELKIHSKTGERLEHYEYNGLS